MAIYKTASGAIVRLATGTTQNVRCPYCQTYLYEAPTVERSAAAKEVIVPSPIEVKCRKCKMMVRIKWQGEKPT